MSDDTQDQTAKPETKATPPSADEKVEPGAEAEGTEAEAAAEGLAAGAAARSASGDDPSTDGALGVLEEAINKAGTRWLKDRFRLEEDEEGRLHLPDSDKLEGLGERAQTFVRGFLHGFFDKTPEELEAQAGLRDPADVPRSSEVVTQLFAKLSHTLTDTWRDYVAEHAEKREGEKLIVDGDFIVHHGAGFLGTMVAALGDAFKDGGREPAGATDAAPPVEDPATTTDSDGEAATAGERAEATGRTAPEIAIRVDMPSIFRSLFTPRS